MHNKYKIRTFTCIGCNNTVSKRVNESKQKYCSIECYRNSKRPQRKTGLEKICKNCGKNIYVRKCWILNDNFCNFKCHNEYQGINKVEYTCKICGKKFKWSKSRITIANPKYCSQKCVNLDTDFIKSRAIKANIVQQNKQGLNKLEIKGGEILKDIGVSFKEQVLMFNKFLVDVLIENKKLIIQWDGVYWHSKPRRKQLDISQDAYFKKCGYNVIRITDEQIKNGEDDVYDIIKTAIR
jgi:very-short-patch-repair endonuclease